MPTFHFRLATSEKRQRHNFLNLCQPIIYKINGLIIVATAKVMKTKITQTTVPWSFQYPRGSFPFPGEYEDD